MMGEPVSTAAVFAFLNSCFKFAEYAVKLYGVESENGVFVRLIQHVQLDLKETERLLDVATVRTKLKSTPEKWHWIKETIVRTKASLDDIGRWVERVRGEQVAYGTVSFEAKVKWIFKDHDKLVTRTMELRTTHQTLSVVLLFLTQLEDPATQPAEDLPTYDDATSMDNFLSPLQKKKKAMYLGSGHRSEKNNAEGTSNEPTMTQRKIHQSSSMIFLPQSTTVFSSFPNSTTPDASSSRPNSDREGDSNGDNSFETIPAKIPPFLYYPGIYGNSIAPLFSTSSLELPRATSSFLTPRRSTESFGQNQLPSLPTSPRKTPEELSPRQPSAYHSAGPVNAFELWVEPATSHASTSPDEVAEMMGELLVRPHSTVPRGVPAWRPESNIVPQETSCNTPSRRPESIHTSTKPANFSTGDFALPNLGPKVPPKIPINDPTPSLFEEIPSPTISQVLQPHDQSSLSAQASSSSRLNARRFTVPSTTASGSKIPHATDIKRKPTRKWVEARRVNYGGEDYGHPMDGYHDPAALQEGQDDEPQEPSQSPPIPQFSYEYQNQNQYQQRQSHPELLQRSHSEPQPNPSTLLHQPPYSQPEAEYQTYNLPEVHPDPRDTSPAPSHPQSRTEYQAYNFPEVHPDPRNASPAPRRQPGAEYQAYRPPPPPPESSATPSYLLPSTGNSSPAPDAALQQHYRSFSLPEVVPPQPPISNQPGPSTPFDGYEAPLERAATVGEMRRRDMKLRLAMMSRGSYG